MSAGSLLSSLREKPNGESLKDGSKPEGDEELSPKSGGGGGGDPAVLALGPARRPLTYSRDDLMRLKHSPLSKRPLDAALLAIEALVGLLKRRERTDSPNDDDRGGRGDAPNDNQKGVYGRDRDRRPADPRERVRKESESGGGIVLSPQRRSFTSGCGAPLAGRRPDSPPPHAAPPADSGPVIAGRRIGSGRIMVRDVTTPAWERDDADYRRDNDRQNSRNDRDDRADYRNRDRGEPERMTNRNNDRYNERRSFGRDSFTSEMKRERDDRFINDKLHRDRDDNRRSGSGRFTQRRFEPEDEPEWFSGGPTSQLETIELRGFDEPKRQNNKDNEKWNNNNNTNNKSNNSGGNSEPSPRERWSPTTANTTTTTIGTDHDNKEKEPPAEAKREEPQSNSEQPDFNLDEFLKLDSIPDVLTNGEGPGGSRFSRWFRRESPPAVQHAPPHHNVMDEMESGGQGPGVGVGTGAGGTVFTPIAPARPPSLLDLLRRANDAQQHPVVHEVTGGSPGKIHSLEELEARLRPHPDQHHDRDISAFKRLLAQVSGGHAVPAERPPPQHPPQPQPMSLLQMLNKSMEQQKAQQQAPPPPPPPHIPQELLYKLLQVQQRQQQQEAPAPAERELLQRPEAQAIIHGLKAGEITAQHLMQQLSNPGLQSRHRELLLTILRMHHQRQQMCGSPVSGGGGNGGTGQGGVAPHLVLPPHAPLRLSPLPHTAFCVSPIMATSTNTLAVHHPPGVPARIPSPRELAVHTQSIMQGALIKKKLEEQRENFRRRQEMQQPKQHTPISFTPTSVLRKMTAEKEGEAPSPKQQQPQWPHKPQGRPIVKGNQSGGPPPMNYPQAEYPQHYLSQQQMPGMRQFPHQQQRQMPPNMNSMNNMGLSGRTPAPNTLHQLLVQSHQRSLNELGGSSSGGGDNQLSRWFSPELLARASAGKLPTVPVPHALSLEELERRGPPSRTPHPPHPPHPSHPSPAPVRN